MVKVLIVGCGLAGLGTALGLVTRHYKRKDNNNNDNNKSKNENIDGEDDDDDENTNDNDRLSSSSSLEIVIVEKRNSFDSRGATFGLAPNGQQALRELIPSNLLVELLQEKGIYMESSGGYMLPWWNVRDALLELAQSDSDDLKLLPPFKQHITIHLGCRVESITNIDQDEPLHVTFRQTADNYSKDDDQEDVEPSKLSSSSSAMLPQDSVFDVVIGADGVHSQIRTGILQLPPPVSTNTVVWRGSVDTSGTPELQDFVQQQLFGTIVKVLLFETSILLSYFNFSNKSPGVIAWVLSCTNASDHNMVPGQTTPIDLLQPLKQKLLSKSTTMPLDEKDQETLQNIRDAELLLPYTHPSSDLTWSTEMAVVDLDSTGNTAAPAGDDPDSDAGRRGWGGKHRITLVGDAAHSLRPASGLGGSMAFEDAVVLCQQLLPPNDKEDKEEEGNTNLSTTKTATTISQALSMFEQIRLPRCRSISRDQTLRSTLSYKVGFAKVPAWEDVYRDWIFQGHLAPSEPPIDERRVFEPLLQELESAAAAAAAGAATNEEG